ncbi:MAG TPA: transcription termination/antitermination NusG family protein [Gemmataceae bacterium]|jgi:transcription antitermination factor NusG|nr:transcription termination/antitermination NusG family protein [Gemmataceae bacterium]
MPLLPREPMTFPEDLFLNGAPEVEQASGWWVLHTKPRTEKSLARKCLQSATPFFLPQYERRWRSQGRMRTAHLPLFPGYLFLFGDEQSRLKALKTNLVVNCLTVADQSQLNSDLMRLYRLITSGAPLTPEERLSPGMWVEITNGPLAGLTGQIIRRGGNARFVVEVQFIQRGVSAELEGWTIQPIDPPHRPAD